jgi:hypothetical protein
VEQDRFEHPVGIPVVHVAKRMRSGFQSCRFCGYEIKGPKSGFASPGYGGGTEVVVLWNPPYRSTWVKGIPSHAYMEKDALACTEFVDA